MRSAPMLNHQDILRATCIAVVLAFFCGCQTAPPAQPPQPIATIDEIPDDAEQPIAEIDERPDEPSEPIAEIDESPGAEVWQAVLAIRDAGESEEMREAVQSYIREYGSHPENSARVLEGMTMIADDHEDRGERSGSVKWYTKAVAEFEARELEPETRAAHFAAKAQFMLVEYEFEEWSKTAHVESLREHRGNFKEQNRVIENIAEEYQMLVRGYASVFAYKDPEWLVAANFRIGSLYVHLEQVTASENLIPFAEGTEEYEEYKAASEALEAYSCNTGLHSTIERWKSTLKFARENGIETHWTRRTLLELNTHLPDKYPLEE